MQPTTPLAPAPQRYLSFLDDTQSDNPCFVFIVARRAVARPARANTVVEPMQAELAIISMLIRHLISGRKELIVYLQARGSDGNIRARNRLRESGYQPSQEIRRQVMNPSKA